MFRTLLPSRGFSTEPSLRSQSKAIKAHAVVAGPSPKAAQDDNRQKAQGLSTDTRAS
jgi:hypothetical protein